MMYYQEDVLFALACSIGTSIKIDVDTRLATRARLARVCVEVDLTKPLVARLSLDDQWYNVEYEGIHTICFIYGMYGHRVEQCSLRTQEENTTTEAGPSYNRIVNQGSPPSLPRP